MDIDTDPQNNDSEGGFGDEPNIFSSVDEREQLPCSSTLHRADPYLLTKAPISRGQPPRHNVNGWLVTFSRESSTFEELVTRTSPLSTRRSTVGTRQSQTPTHAIYSFLNQPGAFIIPDGELFLGLY